VRTEGLDERLQVRASIATGLAVAHDRLGNAPGAEPVVTATTAHVAVRLLTHAAPGAVVITADTRSLLGDLFEYRDLGLVSVRDSPTAVHLSQVLQESDVASRFDALRARQSEMIGRHDELDFLLRRWQRAKRGQSQVVLIGGEPGIGKSRLCRALQDRLADEPHASLLHYCSPYHQGSALYPIIRQLLQAANIGAQDSRDTKLDKLEAYLSRTHANDSDDLALIAALLSIPVSDRSRLPNLGPHQLKDRTLRFLQNQIERTAADQPVLMVFEDLQWIDPTSLELLSLLAEKARSIPFLLVATHRPEFTPPWPNYSCISNLSVSRLSYADGCTLLLRTTGGRKLPPESVDRILSHSDGIPLFIEELTKTFAEGLYEAMGLGRVAPLPGSTIPVTLIAALTARLDRLGPAREIAQIASAIGRDFSYRLVATVSGYQETDLQAALGKLIAAGIVFQRGIPPDAIYVFKHALVQDAAYAGLVQQHRRQLHAAIARALEAESAGVAAAEPELLAHHFSEAALFSDAIEYWRKAGELALGRSAFQEAVRHLTRGIAVTRSLPASPERDRKELGLHIALGPAMRALKGFAAQETLDVYSRARELLQTGTTLVRQLVVQLGLWTVYWGRAEHVSAHQLAQQCLKLTECHGEPAAIARASRIMGMTLWTMGRPLEARVYLQRCLDLNDALEQETEFLGHDDRAAALAYLARALWLLGYLDQAIRVGVQAVTRARTISHPASLAFAMQWQANFGIYGPDTVRAAVLTDELVGLCSEHGIASFEHLARFQKGALTAHHGDAGDGIAVMRAAMAAYGRAGSRANRPMHLGHLASAEARLGRQDVAYDLLQEAIREAEATEEKFFQAELYRIIGEVCLQLRNRDEGVASLERALSIARSQQTRFWELRAATTLADHWMGEGRLAKAGELLAPICGWFTEGFNMPDVRRAKALLQELSTREHVVRRSATRA
jgi:predicted ATPase